MRQELTDTIHNLETNKKYAINVTDIDTGKYICRNKTGEMLQNEYGGCKEFFEKQYEKGIVNIGIQPRIRNGSSNLNAPEPYYALKFGDDKPLNAPSEVYHEKPKQEKTITNMMSLGFPEAMKLYNDSNEKKRLELELSLIKKENETLRKDNETFKNEIFENRFSKEERQEKRASFDGLIGTVLNSPVTEMFMNKFFGTAAGPAIESAQSLGLGNPNLSPLKNEIIEAVSKSSEKTVDLLGQVFEGFNNADFTNNLIESLKIHNLWNPQSQEGLQ
jgi:hypothetical protein